MYTFNKIQKYKLSGKNISQIAREENLDWKTVQKYFNSESPPEIKKRSYKTRVDPLVSFYEKIHDLKKIKDLSYWDIYNELVLKGYIGSYHTVRRYLKSIETFPRERFFEQEYSPGHELQVDFKEDLLVRMDGKEVLVNLFVASFPYSGKIFIKSFPGLNFECFANGLASSFEYYGGIPHRVRQDNLKPCVSSVLKGKSRIYTEKYSQFIEYYGYEVSSCNPGKGNEKGHVERDIRTFTQRIKSRLKIEEIEFNNYDDLNHWILQTVESFQTAISEKFNEEKKFLSPLRPRRPELESHATTVSGSKYGTIRFGKSVYSVPDGYIDQNILVVASAYTVDLFNLLKKQRVASHPRLKDGSESILIEHVVYSLFRKPSALLSWRHRDIILKDEVIGQFYLQIKKQDPHNAEKKLLQVLNLLQHVDLLTIKAAIELWMEGPQTLSAFEFVYDIIFTERRPQRDYHQQKIEPQLHHYDQFIKGDSHAFIY